LRKGQGKSVENLLMRRHGEDVENRLTRRHGDTGTRRKIKTSPSFAASPCHRVVRQGMSA